MNASGTVTKTYDYDAYGNELSRDFNDANPFRYCREYYDTETGFIYLRARYYDPNVGRFISVDPAKDGLNWYTCCNDNPIVFVDKNGLWPTWSQILTVGAIIAVAAVAIVATVASAGTAGAAIGLGVSAAIGVSGATATTLTTIATAGCYAVAGAIGASALSDVNEVFTGYNPIRDSFMDGNQDLYDATRSLLYIGSAAITTLAASNPGLKQGNYQEEYSNSQKINWPPNDGAVEGTQKIVTLKAGSVYGRYGGIHPNSCYMTEYGTDPSKLSLSPNTDISIYDTLIVRRNIENVEQSEIAPWFGSSGGGTQYMLPISIKDLIERGYLEVKK